MTQYLTSFLGFCSLVQLCVLPGYLVCRILKLRGRLETLLFSFALSLLINHALVVGLVVAGAYRPSVLYGILVAELTLLAALVVAQRRAAPRTESVSADAQPLVLDSPQYSFFKHAAWITIAVYFWLAWQNVGTVFMTWDAVGSWNPWGVWWAKGSIPRIWGTYPQLIPTSYSLTYVFMGNTQVQFFAKGMLGLFPLGALLAIYELGRRQRSAGTLAGVTLAGVLMHYVNVAKLENMMFSGYADVPVSFFVTMAFYCVLRAGEEARAERGVGRGATRLIWLGAMMCVAACVTKQTGMFMAAVYPMLLWGLVLRPAGVSIPDSVRRLSTACMVMVALAAPWYVYQRHMIATGQAQDNWDELFTNLHKDPTYVGRLRHGIRMLRGALPFNDALGCLAVLHLFSLLRRNTRWLYVLVIAPMTVIWAVGFSYSLRNLALAVPLMGMAAGVGLVELLGVAGRLAARFAGADFNWSASPVLQQDAKPLLSASGAGGVAEAHPTNGAWGWAGVKLAILVIVVASFSLPRDWLLERQTALQREVGDPSLNKVLYEYHEGRPLRGLISTHYAALNYLPGFESRAIGLPMGSFETYEKHRARSDVHYILIPSWLDPSYNPKIVEDVRRRIESKEYKCVYDKNAWLYVRKMTPTAWELDDALAQAEAHVAAQRFDQAVAVLSGKPLAEAESPGRAYYLLAYGMHHSWARSRAGRELPTSAVDYYANAIDMGMHEFWPRYQRGLLLALLGRREEAISDLTRAARIEPNHAGVRSALEELKTAAGKNGA